MSEQPWQDILTKQPEQGKRLLVKMIGGGVRIATYDRFNYEQWGIAYWKPMPENNARTTL
jgi:hypothetical protein